MKNGKKLILLAIVAMMGLMMATITPVFGSIHDIVESECATQDSQSDNSNDDPTRTAGNDMHPPGQTPNGIGDEESNFRGQNSSNDSAESGEGSKHCTNP